jgi:hypothetical protein
MREEKNNENNLLILLLYKVRRTDVNDSLKNIKKRRQGKGDYDLDRLDQLSKIKDENRCHFCWRMDLIGAFISLFFNQF